MTSPTKEAVEEAKARVRTYLAERAKMRSINREEIHGLHAGDPREAILKASDLSTLLTALQAREEENARLSSECGKLASRCLHEAQGKQALQSALAEALGAMERIMSVETYPAAFLIAREARERLTNGEGGGA